MVLLIEILNYREIDRERDEENVDTGDGIFEDNDDAELDDWLNVNEEDSDSAERCSLEFIE